MNGDKIEPSITKPLEKTKIRVTDFKAQRRTNVRRSFIDANNIVSVFHK